MLEKEIYEKIFKVIAVGAFLIDAEHKIVAWNDWLVRHTNISQEKALGHTLPELFQGFQHLRFDWAVAQVLEFGYPQILSQILNKHLIPIKLDNLDPVEMNMPQHVEIHPVIHNSKTYALVVISDSTELVSQQRALMQMAYELESKSIHDPLTNIYNRRFMQDWLKNQFQQAVREQFSIACCLYDLDHFKAINDQYGHAMGDKVLVAFVDLVKKELRPADLFVRYGGEEFVILQRNASFEEAGVQAERIRQKLERTRLVSGLATGQVTCSVGISFWDPQTPMGDQEFFKLADHALYQAKNSGRNRVVKITP